MHVLNLKKGNTSFDVYILNPGEVFQNFGYSGYDQTVRTTASVFVRETIDGEFYQDVEHDIHSESIWSLIDRLVNDKGFKLTSVQLRKTA